MTGHHCETTIGGTGGGGTGPATSSGGGGGCPAPPMGIQCNGMVVDDFDSNGCLAGRHCNEGAAAGGTSGQMQPSQSRQCPLDNTCPDGSRPCYMVDTRCECKPCPPPQGCTEEKDPQTGFIKVNCQGTATQSGCPSIPAGEEQGCIDKGGKPVNRHDARECGFIDCVFGDVSSNPLAQGRTCPSEQNIQQVKDQCKDGLFVMMDNGGCKVGVCRGRNQQVQQSVGCGMLSGPEREKIEADCKANGQGTVSNFDEKGCQAITCGNPNECRTNLPEEAYMKCKDQGGEMVVKNDNMGCITFQQCVMKGDDSQVYYEQIDKMPQMTDMLSMAFKLENLRMQFNQLRLKTEDIAKYYESVGSGEAERFKRVAGMFSSIEGKIDEIKAKFRDRLESITKDDISEIKHDIDYIRDKMLKDVLYLMLSSSNEIKSITNRSSTDCGVDDQCFDEALRMCRQVAYGPKDSSGATIKITGMDGTNCAIAASMPNTPMGPVSMTCEYPNYAMGIGSLDKLLPFCTGNMVEMINTYASKPLQQGIAKPPITLPGPGGCDTPGTCNDYCNEKQDDECTKWCQENPSACPSFRGSSPQPTQTSNQVQTPVAHSIPTQPSVPSSSGGGGGGQACSGCLNNGVCDPGECSGCADCMNGGG